MLLFPCRLHPTSEQRQQHHPLLQVVLSATSEGTCIPSEIASSGNDFGTLCGAMDDSLPLAYLISFRCYGTWLHGDERGSVDRFHNRYGTPMLPSNSAQLHQACRRLTREPIALSPEQRDCVERALRETCALRKWALRALSARTNHVHAVISSEVRPALILNALKANATRLMREEGHWRQSQSPWSDSGSKRYIWSDASLKRAIDYVLNQ